MFLPRHRKCLNLGLNLVRHSVTDGYTVSCACWKVTIIALHWVHFRCISRSCFRLNTSHGIVISGLRQAERDGNVGCRGAFKRGSGKGHSIVRESSWIPRGAYSYSSGRGGCQWGCISSGQAGRSVESSSCWKLCVGSQPRWALQLPALQSDVKARCVDVTLYVYKSNGRLLNWCMNTRTPVLLFSKLNEYFWILWSRFLFLDNENK